MNPLDSKEWNDQVTQFEDYSFFHSCEWAKVLIDSYHFTPRYQMIYNGEELSGVLPLFFIDSKLTGRRAVSIPFSDFCGPLFNQSIGENELFERIVDICRSERMKSVEIRSSSKVFPADAKNYRTDFRHTLKLNKSESDLLKSFSENTRRNIKKANKKKLDLKIHNDSAGMKIFYEMQCETRKKHGLPPQPISFFNQILENLIKPGYGDILIAQKGTDPIASAIYFKLSGKVLYKYGASYSKYFEFRGNHFVMWEAIKKYLKEGYVEFDFGRTELENEGLRRFKLGWNTDEHSIFTSRYSLEKNEFLPATISTRGIHNFIFGHTPIFLLKLIGNSFYKYVA